MYWYGFQNKYLPICKRCYEEFDQENGCKFFFVQIQILQNVLNIAKHLLIPVLAALLAVAKQIFDIIKAIDM